MAFTHIANKSRFLVFIVREVDGYNGIRANSFRLIGNSRDIKKQNRTALHVLGVKFKQSIIEITQLKGCKTILGCYFAAFALCREFDFVESSS